MYMVMIGKILTRLGSQFTYGQPKMEVHKFLEHEKFIAKTAPHALAKTTRQGIHEILENKQIELKSIP